MTPPIVSPSTYTVTSPTSPPSSTYPYVITLIIVISIIALSVLIITSFVVAQVIIFVAFVSILVSIPIVYACLGLLVTLFCLGYLCSSIEWSEGLLVMHDLV